MCLAVPGRVSAWLQRDGLFAEAWVEFSGIRRRVAMACAPDADVGDYVLVHAGMAITRVDAEEASRILDAWQQTLHEGSMSEDLASPGPEVDE